MQPTVHVSLCLYWCIVVLSSFASLEMIDFERDCIHGDYEKSLSCVNLNLTAVPNAVPGEINFLNLSHNEIHEIIDTDFSHLPELKYLDLSHNGLSNISIDAFSKNSQLQILWLNHNDLVSDNVLPASKVSLEELYLASNQINEVHKLIVFTSLSVLDLSENSIDVIPETFFADLPKLQNLSLARNQIRGFVANVTETDIKLIQLNLSFNALASFHILGQMGMLEVLDLSWNRMSVVDPDWFIGLPSLTTFIFSGNPVVSIPDFAFSSLPSLEFIELNHLQNLTVISRNTFYGLQNLSFLHLAHNSRLSSVNNLTIHYLTRLKHIDLSDNALISVDPDIFSNLTTLDFLDISGNPWPCDCDVIKQLALLESMLLNYSCTLHVGSICEEDPLNSTGQSLDNLITTECQSARIKSYKKEAYHEVGSSAMLDCKASGYPKPEIVWVTNRNITLMYTDLNNSQYLTKSHYPHKTSNSYDHENEQANRMFVFPNGSLYISYVTRKESGTYTCMAANEFGNDSISIEFRLNYGIMSTVTITSIIIGFLTAAGFFLIAVIIGIARYLAFVCSKKERKKRKSIREVLEAIQDYKTAQFDRFSAYRTAKMDQLSAFKTAKIDQFSAFKHARIDKLRTYKQATVTSILQYLERMREHYANQTARIKENCTQQMDRLRENYGIQRGKFKDYRSHQVEKMRENYNAQVIKIREYSVQQMARLRDQYKAQQQNVLKLLELLDVGNCVTVIEAECMHTESVIFDASIAFDFEAHPIHVPRDTDSTLSDESHYLTASESGSGSMNDIPSALSRMDDAEFEAHIAKTLADIKQMDECGDTHSRPLLADLSLDALDLVEIHDDRMERVPSVRETEC